jgi:hypothetical protein
MAVGSFIRRDLWFLAAGAGFLAWAGVASADTAPMRLRATIETVKGNELGLITRADERLKVRLAPDATIVAIVPMHLEDIKPGSYIGCAALPQADGTLRALEIHVFPENMRGTGEGHRPFDLQPHSTMTNGTVGTVTGSNGRTLTVTYQGGEQTITVAPDTPIVTYEPGTPSLLAPTAHLIATVRRAPDGALTATRVSVGKDGLVPPM